MASPTQCKWVWVNSGGWWWTGRPGMLWFMGSQRVGHDWATELNWTEWSLCFGRFASAIPSLSGVQKTSKRKNMIYLQVNVHIIGCWANSAWASSNKSSFRRIYGVCPLCVFSPFHSSTPRHVFRFSPQSFSSEKESCKTGAIVGVVLGGVMDNKIGECSKWVQLKEGCETSSC